jgi:hypothetical protein
MAQHPLARRIREQLLAFESARNYQAKFSTSFNFSLNLMGNMTCPGATTSHGSNNNHIRQMTLNISCSKLESHPSSNKSTNGQAVSPVAE